MSNYKFFDVEEVFNDLISDKYRLVITGRSDETETRYFNTFNEMVEWLDMFIEVIGELNIELVSIRCFKGSKEITRNVMFALEDMTG